MGSCTLCSLLAAHAMPLLLHAGRDASAPADAVLALVGFAAVVARVLPAWLAGG